MKEDTQYVGCRPSLFYVSVIFYFPECQAGKALKMVSRDSRKNGDFLKITIRSASEWIEFGGNQVVMLRDMSKSFPDFAPFWRAWGKGERGEAVFKNSGLGWVG